MPQSDKRVLLAEGLAAGEEDAALHARLVGAGVSAAAAKYEVHRLGKDPMAAMLRQQAARMTKQRWLLANQERLAREADEGFALDALAAPDSDHFYRHYYEANRPAKLTGIIDHWPALTRWSLDHFARVAGDAVVEAHVDAMIASIPIQAAWAIGALVAVVFGGGWLLDMLAIAQRFHAPAIGLGVFIVEVGMIGIEIWDYVAGWRGRRDGIEAAVAARAPLPIDPARLGSGHNWFQTGALALVVPIILLAFASHLDEGLIERIDWRWVFAAIPLAWGLHFAAKWYDRRIKNLRR